jgi:hypothetical protein
MTNRPPITHLLAIALALAALAGAAWWYSNANEPVEGIPAGMIDDGAAEPPSDPVACEIAGGVWNECASACPPDAEACILMCVPKCEGIAEGESVASVHFPNAKLDPEHLDCSVVFPVRRALLVDGPVASPRAALEALLRGPTDAERDAGYFTSLPDGAAIRSFGIEGGVARVDFDAALARVAGSCRVASIRAQVEETLRRYPGITDVVITVMGGDPGEALQP